MMIEKAYCVGLLGGIAFRPLEAAEIIGIEYVTVAPMAPRRLSIHVRYADGVEDWNSIEDMAEFKEWHRIVPESKIAFREKAP